MIFSFLKDETHLAILLISILSLSFLLTGTIWIYLKNKNYTVSINNRKKSYIEQVLVKAIILEDDENIELTSFFIRKCKTSKSFRQIIIDQLIEIKKSLGGASGTKINLLYSRLNLKETSKSKLYKKAWNSKVKGIQELMLMEQSDEFENILSFSNHKNKEVRTSAQLTIIEFKGYEGLIKILDTANYLLSDWVQINFLKRLKQIPSPAKEIKRWLFSPNYTVVIIALKLIRNFLFSEYHDSVIKCLVRKNAEVRIEAATTLQFIFNETTASLLIESYYEIHEKNFKLTVLNVIKKISGDEEIPFFLMEFQNDDDDIKMSAAKGLYELGKLDLMESMEYSKIYPWRNIIDQVKSDKK